jgi:hypothetical protein
MITDDAAPTPEIEAAANFGTAVELVAVDHSVQEGKALAHEYGS